MPLIPRRGHFGGLGLTATKSPCATESPLRRPKPFQTTSPAQHAGSAYLTSLSLKWLHDTLLKTNGQESRGRNAIWKTATREKCDIPWDAGEGDKLVRRGGSAADLIARVTMCRCACRRRHLSRRPKCVHGGAVPLSYVAPRCVVHQSIHHQRWLPDFTLWIFKTYF